MASSQVFFLPSFSSPPPHSPSFLTVSHACVYDQSWLLGCEGDGGIAADARGRPSYQDPASGIRGIGGQGQPVDQKRQVQEQGQRENDHCVPGSNAVELADGLRGRTGGYLCRGGGRWGGGGRSSLMDGFDWRGRFTHGGTGLISLSCPFYTGVKSRTHVSEKGWKRQSVLRMAAWCESKPAM